ncbi:hypothetical protein [Streptacidiphilus jiangxiensis]|uniref:Peptide chain release factor 1 (ERF1) n=1 Tax=Streptacidiphilus jiangxiensis TaxID=235985 RepID=A0A1H7MZH5_STRJI|nr:hypothetical protein [Streptacidiphilus jiangxiensis]SEL16594.1 hypothetical protein SAMN05414137_106142 [Streptacidiphilus jiangxiensis]
MELTFLHPLLDRPGPWASVVIDTSRATEDGAKQNELRRRAAVRALARLGADPRTVDAVDRWLAGEPASDAPPGRALYACDGKVVLDLPLACAPVGVATAWAALPRLAPLLSLASARPRALLARIDRTGADLELCDGQGRQPVGTAQGPQWRGRGHHSLPADRFEWHYQHRVEDGWERTAQVIADEVVRRHDEAPASLVVLAGDARERHEVRRRLPGPVAETVVELTAGGGRAPGGSDEALDQELERARTRAVDERTERALAELAAGRARDPRTGHALAHEVGGRTAEGVPQVLGAARDRSLATLLLDPSAPDTARTVWTGPDPCQLAPDRHAVRALGAAYPLPARADDALLRAAAALDADAVMTPTAEPGPVGGVGALLRWPHPVAA